MVRIGLILFSLLACLWPQRVRADACPDCPPGCIPTAFVETFKQPAVVSDRACPAGCSALETVKVLRDEPGCLLPAAGQVAAPAAAPEGLANEESTRNRLIVGSTALSAPVGEVSFTGLFAGLWDVEYALDENLQIGSYVVLPVYVAGVFPTFKAQVALGDHLHLGGGALVGLVGPYAGSEAGGFAFVAGGHAEASLTFGDHLLNLSLVAVGAGLRGPDEDMDWVEGAILIPDLGYHWAFHPNWSFQVELASPLLVDHGGLVNDEAIFVLAYGFRGHGDVLFGDVGFVLPLFSDYIDDIWKYTPLGIPYFSIGVKI